MKCAWSTPVNLRVLIRAFSVLASMATSQLLAVSRASKLDVFYLSQLLQKGLSRIVDSYYTAGSLSSLRDLLCAITVRKACIFHRARCRTRSQSQVIALPDG